MPEASHPSSLRVVRAIDLVPQPWKNGAGHTRQIACGPGSATGDGDWDWRMSVADVDAAAPFSTFPGIERELVLLHGEGIRLRFDDDGSEHLLLPPHGRLRFGGERPLHGAPVAGPTSDFNLMWRRDLLDAALWQRPLVGSVALFADEGETWAVHLIAGHAHVQQPGGLRLGSGDTLLFTGEDGRSRLMLDGHGEALLVRIRDQVLRGDADP